VKFLGQPINCLKKLFLVHSFERLNGERRMVLQAKVALDLVF
jgi:hypothetical protein